jgi:hypothetical protein
MIKIIFYIVSTMLIIGFVLKSTKQANNNNLQAIPVANIKLSDGTSILNAQSGKDWTNYSVKGVHVYDYSDTLIIDDSDTSKIFYSAKDNYKPHKWTISNTNKWEADEESCNCSFSAGPWDYMIIKFTNTKRVEWWGEKMPHHGLVNIYFDEAGWEQVNNIRTLEVLNYDTYSADPDPMVLHWAKDSLDRDKVYELYIIPTGNKNDQSTGTYVVNRGFKLINPPPHVVVPDTVYIIDTLYIIDTVFLTPNYYFLPDSILLK